MGVTNEALELQSSVFSLFLHLIDLLSPHLSCFFNLFHPLTLSFSLSLSILSASVPGWLFYKGSHVTVLRVNESQSSATEIIAM